MGAFDIMNWLKIYDYRNLDGFLRSQKGQGGLNTAILRAFASAMVSFTPSLLIQLAYIIFGIGSIALAGSFAVESGVGGVVAMFLFSLITSLAMFLLNNLAIHVIAGMMGGRGNYSDLSHLMSYLNGAVALSVIPFTALGLAAFAEPTVGCLMLILELAWLVYVMYANYRIVIANYELSKGKAIATLAIDWAIWIVMYLLLIMVLISLDVVQLPAI